MNNRSFGKHIRKAAALLTLLLAVLINASAVFAGGFEVHFIDVGQGDSALILCDDEAMLIDGGDSKASSLIYTYLKEHKVDRLKYMIATHPDEDHIGGLAGALNYAAVDTAFCPVTEHDTRAFESFVKYLNKQGKSITVPLNGTQFRLGSASVRLIGPVSRSSVSNNNSIVARVTYGNTSFLFTGDAEAGEEHEIIRSGAEVRSDVLKVGHHGSLSSTSNEFLKAVDPKYAVISVGKDNSYGHPEEGILEMLTDRGISIFRTDLNGDIICKSDGNSISFTVEHDRKESGQSSAAAASGKTSDSRAAAGGSNGGSEGDAADRNAAAAAAGASSGTAGSTAVGAAAGIAGTVNGSGSSGDGCTYILNTNTRKFHYPDCKSVKQMKDKNKSEFSGTRDEAIAQGYSPCGNCHP